MPKRGTFDFRFSRTNTTRFTFLFIAPADYNTGYRIIRYCPKSVHPVWSTIQSCEYYIK